MTPAAARRLTPLEAAHVNGKLRAQRWGRWGTMGASLMLAVVGVGLFASIGADRSNDAGLILGLMAVGSLSVAAGAWIFVVSWRRRFTVDDHVTELTGPMVERVVHVTNPRSGVRQTVRSYHVHDTLLLLPFGGDAICRQRVDRSVRVVAALIHKSNPIQPFGAGSALSEGSSDAVLLELDELIDIDHVLRTYGRHYFRRRQLRETVVYGLASALTIVPLFWWILTGIHDHEDAMSGGWTRIGMSIVGFVVTALLLEWLYDRMEQRVAPLPDELTHEERLRRPALPTGARPPAP